MTDPNNAYRYDPNAPTGQAPGYGGQPVNPYGNSAYPSAGYPAPGQPNTGYQTQPTGTNGMAIASLVCAFVFSLLAVIFGHSALSQIKKTGQEGRGLAIAGLVLGYIGLIGGIIWLIYLIAAGATLVGNLNEFTYSLGALG